MVKLQYNGPFTGTDVIGGDRLYQVRRGGTVDVPEAIATNLLQSPDWSLAEPAEDVGPVSDLELISGLSEAQRSALEAIDLGTLAALAVATDDDITSADGVGPGTLKLIREALGQIPEA